MRQLAAILTLTLVAIAIQSCDKQQQVEELDLIPVKIVGLYDYEEGGVGVFLQSEGSEIVPIVIGEFEARALQMALAGRSTPRPLAYDLFSALLDDFDGSIDRLVVDSIVDNVFHGRLEISANGRTLAIDCRPSDGMVLATRTEAPIYLTSSVIEQAGTEREPAKKVVWMPSR